MFWLISGLRVTTRAEQMILPGGRAHAPSTFRLDFGGSLPKEQEHIVKWRFLGRADRGVL